MALTSIHCYLGTPVYCSLKLQLGGGGGGGGGGGRHPCPPVEPSLDEALV